MRRRSIFLSAVLASVVGATLLAPVQVLEVSGRRGGQVLWRAVVSTGDVFTFDYIHSVEKTPVEGRFAVEPDGWLRLVETRFPSHGSGLPESADGRSEDGRWMIAAGGQRMPELGFFISPVNRAGLQVGGSRVDLSQRVAAGDVAVIAVSHRPRILAYAGAG
jgi:hypothetical protein